MAPLLLRDFGWGRVQQSPQVRLGPCSTADVISSPVSLPHPSPHVTATAFATSWTNPRAVVSFHASILPEPRPVAPPVYAQSLVCTLDSLSSQLMTEEPKGSGLRRERKLFPGVQRSSWWNRLPPFPANVGVLHISFSGKLVSGEGERPPHVSLMFVYHMLNNPWTCCITTSF